MTAVIALTELHTYDENENKNPHLPISVILSLKQLMVAV
jgi:hypothetical protein